MSNSSSADFHDAERRVAPRLRTLKQAKVLFNNRFSTIDCVVRNISRTGALLTVDTAVHLPKSFEVMIGVEELRPARLVYRREIFAGIRFLDVEEAENDAVPPTAPSSYADVEARNEGGGIALVIADPLPRALLRNFPWSRFG